MSKENVPVVNKKNSKDEIFEAYLVALNALDSKAETTVDFQKEAAEKSKKETLKEVETFSVNDSEKAINSLVNDLQTIKEDLSILAKVKESILIKESELKELFGIEKAAHSLAALVNANREVKEKVEFELLDRKAQVDAELKEAQEEKAKAIFEKKAEIDRLEKEATEKRKREWEEWDYNFRRSKQQQKDALLDEITKDRKEFEEELQLKENELNKRTDVLNLRNADASEREKKLDAMEQLIASFPGKLEEAVKAAKAEGKSEADKSNAFEVRYIKRDAEAKVEVLENKIVALEAALEAEKARSLEAQVQAKEAMNKLESLASKTVDGASSAKYASALESALKENSKKSN